LFKESGDKKIIGEKSVYYLLSKDAAVNIYRFNPQAKIIIMLRNPVDMLQSYHAQQLYNKHEVINHFESALKAEAARTKSNISTNKLLRFKEKLYYSQVVSYTEQVQRFLSLFSKEQVLVIIYDDFKKDTAGVYRKTLEFLNVDATFQIDFPVINARKIISANSRNNQGSHKLFFLSVIEQSPLLLNFTEKIVPKPIRKYLLRFLRGSEPVNQQNQQYPPMSPRTRKKLQNKYRLEVKRLSVLLGRDLNYWCNDIKQ